MKTKILTFAMAAAIAIGTAGLATTASAATPTVNLSAVTTTPDRNVQTVGVRVRVARKVRRHSRRSGSRRPGGSYRIVCLSYRARALAGNGRARGRYYRIGCHRIYGPIPGKGRS